MSSPRNYGEKSLTNHHSILAGKLLFLAFLTPYLQANNSLPKSPPTSPIFDTTPLPPSPNSSNPTFSSLPPQTPTPNHSENRLHELLHLSNLLDITIQNAIELTNRSPPSSPFTHPPELVVMDDGKRVEGPMMRDLIRIMDYPNITMEDYIRLEEEKALRRAIVFDDAFTSEVTPSYKPTVSPVNDNKIDFRVSFDEFDDEDYTSNNPSFPSPEPTVSYFDDLDFFKDFEKEFPAIVYNDALTSKSDFLTEPTVNPQHIDEFNLNNETSLSECDEK
ncbi:hypothetical protein Tco_1368303 [Tanacetum coccineum]